MKEPYCRGTRVWHALSRDFTVLPAQSCIKNVLELTYNCAVVMIQNGQFLGLYLVKPQVSGDHTLYSPCTSDVVLEDNLGLVTPRGQKNQSLGLILETKVLGLSGYLHE